ncbi:MAG: zonular occludens toxin domain-containing protein [Candidatus Micrarchaeota archaeon]
MKKGKTPIWKKALGAIGGMIYKLLVFIWGAAKWIAVSLFHLFVKLFESIFHLTRNSITGAIGKQKRPKDAAQKAEFVVLETASGNFADFENYLLSSKSSIGIVLGARGSGKSALGMRILENVHAKKGRKVAAMGFQKESIPNWIASVEKLEEIPNGSFVLVDEGGIIFSARESLSDANKILSELLLISRHKDLSVLFISQNSSNLDINALRQADYLLLRKSSLLQKDFERKKIQEVYTEAKPLFDKFGSERQKITYIYSDDFRGIISNPLPSFWSEKASKGFSGFKPK